MANLKYKKDDSWISISAVRGPKGDNADITLNGQTSQNVSLYAPIEGGSIGQYLSASGDGKAPKWKDLALPIVGNGTLTIQKNGTSIGTFSANTSSNQSINIEVPTNQNIVDLIYPIGSIYLTLNQTNPAILFGGEWEQIKDKFLIGVGDSHNLGNNYGSNTKNLSHTHAVQDHILTIAEIPEHTHKTGIQGHNSFDYTTDKGDGGNTAVVLFNQTAGVATSSTGGGGAHNHGNTTSQLSSTFDITPASVAVYIWERIG